MEKALRYELIQAIPELSDLIYPTNAPESMPKDSDGATKPYLVYARINTAKEKTLDGYTGKEALSYMFSIMDASYGKMVSVRKKVEELLVGMVKREVGDANKFYVEDLTINKIEEQYEHELKINRGIIDFTIYFEGVK